MPPGGADDGEDPPRPRPARRPVGPRIDDRLISAVVTQLRRGHAVRRRLPGDGRIAIDRPLPFLALYRPPPGRLDPGTAALVEGEASYLIAPRARGSRAPTQRLVEAVVETLGEVFGAFLVVELWSAAPPPRGEEDPAAPPAFRVVAARGDVDDPSTARLLAALARVRLHRVAADVELRPGGRLAPPGFAPVLAAPERRRRRCQVVGLEVRAVYQDPSGTAEYPLLRQVLQRQVGRALKQGFFEFVHSETPARPAHYQALGRRAVVKAVWTVDAALADIAASFDLLLLVTPTNTEQAWRAFQRSRYGHVPPFRYRPIPFDPALLKRRLYQIPIERVEDPTLLRLFEDKRRELDLKLTLLMDRGTPRFLPTSVATYGAVDGGLAGTAAHLLTALPPEREGGGRGALDAGDFRVRADAELAHYRSRDPSLDARVEVRDDIASLMVSAGRLLVGSGLRFPSARVDALLQHEIGTHVVTWHNGRAQRFRLLASGLPGYDELQEGLGVFAEWVVGGLDPVRLRMLAARVLAVRLLLDGAALPDAHRYLRDVGLSARGAFLVAARVWRGGGFVKDAVYLRGLQSVLDHLRDGGELRTLFVGKIARTHVGIVDELLRRRILTPARLLPRYLEDEAHAGRLAAARNGIAIAELL